MTDKVKNIRIADFDYPLPDERIARHPLADRASCKLLVSDGRTATSHHVFSELPSLLPSGSLLVCNDTRVINARIRFEKETGSKIEVFLLEPVSPEDYVLMFQARGHCRWSCMIGNLKRWKGGKLIKQVNAGGTTITLEAERIEAHEGNAHVVEFTWNDDSVTFASVVDAAGFIPIPPYLKRDSEASDTDDYQTVYARIKGSVAAPTAGLHFTPEVFDRLSDNGIEICHVTLHVGAGTFQPVKSAEIGEHPMHTEVFTVSRESVAALRDAIKQGRPITAVGTTSVRTVESLPRLGLNLLKGDLSMNVTQWEAYDEEQIADTGTDTTLRALDALIDYMDSRNENSLTATTSIMIAPGFRWRIVNLMVTNFHQPQSTLLLLVSSFLGDEGNGAASVWRDIYQEALDEGYRFLSYGDACLFKRTSE